jgi:preprotein translocase subunit YajC
MVLPFIVIFGIIYFIVIRPTRQNQKKVQEMIEGLRVGDKIITNGGIYGTIVGLRDDRIQLRVAENVKIDVARNAISALQHPDQEQTKS